MKTRAAKHEWTVFDVLGALCVVMVLLLSGGVSVARAEAPPEALMSIDPALVAPSLPPLEAPIPPAMAPGSPEIVLLNTRGYNYGPPPSPIDPAAIALERGPAAPDSPEAR